MKILLFGISSKRKSQTHTQLLAGKVLAYDFGIFVYDLGGYRMDWKIILRALQFLKDFVS